VGKGTGLGLSTCFGIVNALGGKLDVRTTLGRGTVFRVTLPLVAPEAEDATPGAERVPGGLQEVSP